MSTIRTATPADAQAILECNARSGILDLDLVGVGGMPELHLHEASLREFDRIHQQIHHDQPHKKRVALQRRQIVWNGQVKREPLLLRLRPLDRERDRVHLLYKLGTDGRHERPRARPGDEGTDATGGQVRERIPDRDQ